MFWTFLIFNSLCFIHDHLQLILLFIILQKLMGLIAISTQIYFLTRGNLGLMAMTCMRTSISIHPQTCKHPRLHWEHPILDLLLLTLAHLLVHSRQTPLMARKAALLSLLLSMGPQKNLVIKLTPLLLLVPPKVAMSKWS